MDNENNTRKKKGNFKARQFRYVIATAIVLIALLGFSVAVVLRLYFMTESSCYDKLSVETENSITQLESNFRSDRTMLRVIAGMIGSAGDIDSLEVSGYLNNYDYNSLITQIGVLLPDDKLMSSKGFRSNVDGTLVFENESKLGEHINGAVHTDTNSKSVRVRNFVPIREDGIITALLFSTANSSSVAKAWLPSVYDKKGYCYVVDRKTGSVIINTSSDGIMDIDDISFKQTDDDYTKDETISNILNGRKGYSVFESAELKEKIYMCYLPFSIEDWEMVVFVPESAVFSDVTPVRNGMYMLIVIWLFIIILYALWLVREMRASLADTEMRANVDVLTGLENRNRYEAYLQKLSDSKEKVTCLFIDANGLHELNNTKGHNAGDQMLRFIADTLKVQFSNDHIYRIGGDEFVVFQSGMTDEELNEKLAQFREALHRNDYNAAVGSCVYEEGMSVDQLIVNAEKNMYDSKKKYYEKIGKDMRI